MAYPWFFCVLLWRWLSVMWVCGCLSQSLQAQQHPISATLQITPPYSIYLPDYALPGSEQMKLFLLLRDLSEPDYPVRLHLTVEGAGIRIETSPSFMPSPVTLQGGVPAVLTATDLAPYLYSRNLLFSGITLQQYEKRGSLPEGFYRFTFRVLDYRRQDIVLSNDASFMAWFVLNDPPRINAPLCGTTLQLADPQTILFQWMPGNVGSPNSMLDTEYEFTLVEVRPKGRNPNDAILSTVPLYQTTTPSTSLLYGFAEPALIPGQQYAFRVQARDQQGRDLFKNQGYSEVCTFTYGEVAPLEPPDFVHVYADAQRRAQVSWRMSINPDSYRVEYRKQPGKGEEHAWFQQETTSDQVTLYDLEPATTYEVRVASLFQTFASRYTPTQTFTTPAQKVMACGQAPAPPLSAETQPLLTAIAGQYWKVGNFEMQLLEVQGGDGNFSGIGSMHIPYLGLQVPVQFESVKVNQNRELVWGEVVALREDITTFRQRWKETHPEPSEPIASGEEEKATGENQPPADPPTPTNNITVAGTIAAVQVSEKGEILVTGTDGKQTTYAQPQQTADGEKKETVISDAAGNIYKVDKDGKVTKDASAAESGDSPDNSDTPNPNNLSPELELILRIQDQLIISVIDEFDADIEAWLKVHGKGPLSKSEMFALLGLPKCFPEDKEILIGIQENILPDIKERPRAFGNVLRAQEKDRQFFDKLAEQFDALENVDPTKVKAEEWADFREMACQPIPKWKTAPSEGLTDMLDHLKKKAQALHQKTGGMIYGFAYCKKCEGESQEILDYEIGGKLLSVMAGKNAKCLGTVYSSSGSASFNGNHQNFNDWANSGQLEGYYADDQMLIALLDDESKFHACSRFLGSALDGWDYCSQKPTEALITKLDELIYECLATDGIYDARLITQAVRDELEQSLNNKLYQDEKFQVIFATDTQEEILETTAGQQAHYTIRMEKQANGEWNMSLAVSREYLASLQFNESEINELLSYLDELFLQAQVNFCENAEPSPACVNEMLRFMQVLNLNLQSLADAGTVHPSMWDNTDPKNHLIPNQFTWVPMVGGAIDGITEEVSSIPVLIKTVGGLMLDTEQRKAFQAIFTDEGWEQLKKGLFSSLVKTITQKNKREYTVSKASVEMILAYYLLISKAVTGLAEAMDRVNDLAKKIDKTPGLQRYLKKIVKDTPDADKAQKLEKLLDNIGSKDLEALISRLPEDKIDDLIADLSDDLTLAGRLVDEPELVDSWKALSEFSTLRKNPANLEMLTKVRGKFTYNGKTGQGALEEVFSGHKSAQKFIDNLNKAEELFEGVGVKHWSGIKSSGEVRLVNDAGVVVGKVDNETFTVTAAKGSRPAPNTYLTQKYIDDHLAKFTNEGVVSRIVSEKDYQKYGIGKPDNGKTEFIGLKSEIDRILSLPIEEQAKILGVPVDQLKGSSRVRVDFKLSDKYKVEIPSGNEFGANPQWIPGGKLPTGYHEAVIKTEGMQIDVDFFVKDL